MTKATVTDITDNSVFVAIENDSQQCDTCQHTGGCAVCSDPDRQTIIEGRYIPSENDNLPIAVGDEVYIDIRPETKVVSSLILFVIPIAALFGTYRLSAFFTDSELLSIICSCIGLAVAVIAVVAAFRNDKIKDKIKPNIYKSSQE